jgi:hypothetical protein
MPDSAADPIHHVLRDGGPNYVETPPDLERFAGSIAEPWNTGSAALFVLIPIIWAWLLRGRYRETPFLVVCLPILATGGIGGVLFHGLRSAAFYRFLDVIPIYLLGFSVSVWLWIRLGPKLRHLLGMIAFLALLQSLAVFRLTIHWAINISYATLAALVLIPLILALVRTRFRHAGWVYSAVAFFAIALLCRGIDPIRPPLLPMGTHWLWHTFGALTAASLSVYVYRIEKVPLSKAADL